MKYQCIANLIVVTIPYISIYNLNHKLTFKKSKNESCTSLGHVLY